MTGATTTMSSRQCRGRRRILVGRHGQPQLHAADVAAVPQVDLAQLARRGGRRAAAGSATRSMAIPTFHTTRPRAARRRPTGWCPGTRSRYRRVVPEGGRRPPSWGSSRRRRGAGRPVGRVRVRLGRSAGGSAARPTAARSSCRPEPAGPARCSGPARARRRVSGVELLEADHDVELGQRCRGLSSDSPVTSGTSTPGAPADTTSVTAAADVDQLTGCRIGADHQPLGDAVALLGGVEREQVRVALEQRRASSSGRPTTLAGTATWSRPRTRRC